MTIHLVIISIVRRFSLRPTCAKSLLRPYKTKTDAQQYSDDPLTHVLRLQHKEEKRDLTMRVNHI